MSVAPTWECQRSIDVDVPVSFAWAYMTDIRNWNDPPAEFALEGPFGEGARGTTHIPGQPPVFWTIRDVEPGRAYTIGSLLERAVLLVRWRFEPLTERTVRLTQRMELLGENAAAYVDGIRSAFEPNLEPGMRRIAQTMERRHSGGGSGTTRSLVKKRISLLFSSRWIQMTAAPGFPGSKRRRDARAERDL